jgi:hypothetical protein
MKLPDLTDAQRALLKSLRSPVPPHLSALADQLVAVISEEQATHTELSEATADTTAFPAIVQFWRDWKARIDRHVEGVRAPLRVKLRDLADLARKNISEPDVPVVETLRRLDDVIQNNSPIRSVVEKLQQPGDSGDVIDDIASAISGKAATALTDEDYGRAVGVIEMASVFQKLVSQFAVILPTGERRVLEPSPDSGQAKAISKVIGELKNSVPLTTDQLTHAILSEIYNLASPQNGELSSDAVGDAGSDATAISELRPTGEASDPQSVVTD